MIQKFVDRYTANKDKLEEKLSKQHPDSYADLVREVVHLLHSDDEYSSPDPDRIHQIDDGDYQGTLLFIIADSSYQPNTYWSVKIFYGSCSGCDTLEAIRAYSYDKAPTKEQIKDYMTLCLHIVQKLTFIGEETV